MNLFELLEQDHKQVKAIFEKLCGKEDINLDKREDLFEKLKGELTLHATAEEMFFYPAIKDDDVTHSMTLEGFEEHKVVKHLLHELDTNDKSRDEWMAKLKVLKENFEHHVKEEEGDLFKKAKKVLSDDDAQSIADDIEEFKAEIMIAMAKD